MGTQKKAWQFASNRVRRATGAGTILQICSTHYVRTNRNHNQLYKADALALFD